MFERRYFEHLRKEGLRNRYILQRHWPTEVSLRHIIITDPKNAISGYGLPDYIQEQARNADYSLIRNLDPKKTVIVYSDFLRAAQTAAITGDVLGIDKFERRKELRERYFGQLEKASALEEQDGRYQEIRRRDAKHPRRAKYGAESVIHVRKRIKKLIKDLEERYKGYIFILVGHADFHQILGEVFLGIQLGKHDDVDYLYPGSILEVFLAKRRRKIRN